MKTLGLVESDIRVEELGFDLNHLTNARFYRFLRSRKIDTGGAAYVIVEFDSGDLSFPDAVPLVIGLIYQNQEFVPHVVWDNKVWHILSDDALQSLVAITGIKADSFLNSEIARFFERSSELLSDHSKTQRQRPDAGDVSPSAGGSVEVD